MFQARTLRRYKGLARKLAEASNAAELLSRRLAKAADEAQLVQLEADAWKAFQANDQEGQESIHKQMTDFEIGGLKTGYSGLERSKPNGS